MSNGDVFGVVKAMVADQIAKANAIAERVQKSRVNVGKVVHEIRKDENTTDETVKAFQTKLEKANAQIEKWTAEVDEYIKANLVQASSMSDEEYEKAKAEYAELKKGATAAQKLAANLPGYDAATFSDLPSLMTLSGGTSGSATGTKRPRLASLTINGDEVYTEKETDEGKVKSFTFTHAAEVISKESGQKVKPSDLSAAAFEAAGTDDLSTVNDVEFNYSVGEKEYALVVIPQQSAE
jgi:hypothetical protein